MPVEPPDVESREAACMRLLGEDPLLPRERKRFSDWGAFYQSPVTKAAGFLHSKVGTPEVLFDDRGRMREDAGEGVESLLWQWLQIGTKDPRGETLRGALKTWVQDGRCNDLGEDLRTAIRDRLRAESMRESDMYGRPVLRLVRFDQILAEPGHPAPYQLTPVQERLLASDADDTTTRADDDCGPLAVLRDHQHVYWGLSEEFQSLLALFDSDLGRQGESAFGTKEFIQVREKAQSIRTSSAKGYYTPHELNRFSPLRFWAPPSTFFSTVIHLLLWRGVITRLDLYGRPVRGKTPEERASTYFVIENAFNSAKYRVTDYAALFDLLWALARTLTNVHPRAWRTRKEPIRVEAPSRSSSPRRERGSTLRDLAFTPHLLQGYGPRRVGFPSAARCSLTLPSGAMVSGTNPTAFDLTSGYRENGIDEQRHVLLYLRDKMVELILWSLYQREIRSVGMVPIRRLYRLRLASDHPLGTLEDLFLHGDREQCDRAFRDLMRTRPEAWFELDVVYSRSAKGGSTARLLDELEQARSLHLLPEPAAAQSAVR